MWVKEYLSKSENEYYKKFNWYYEEYEKFSNNVSDIISAYKKNSNIDMSTYPPYLGFSLTYQCNLTCPMCFQDRKNYKNNLSLEEYQKIATEIGVNNNRPWVTLWGGEPTLHSKFQGIYHAFLAVTGVLTICTNGTRLNRFSSLFTEKDAHTLWVVSIDGLEKTHNFIRGEGNYSKTVKNLSEAIRLRNESNSQHMFAVEVTLLKDNKDEVISLIKELINIGVDWIALNHLWFLPEQIIDIYEKELESFSEYRCTTGKNRAHGFTCSSSDLVDPIELHNVVKQAKEMYRDKIHILEMPTYNSPEEVEQHYNYNAKKEKEEFKCYKNLVKLDFNTEGDAVVCKQYPDLAFGSIKTQNINDIWFSSERQNIMKKMIANDAFSICHMCPDRALSLPYN